jgi:hypothetical protein
MVNKMAGENTSPAEITGLTAIGLWLLAGDREYFVPFADYPTFRQATVEQIVNLHQPAPDQLCWPDLDIDIELPALDEPERFPLAYVPS